jgi:uncharacterized membrane protein YoaK (UPF0700 family)
MNRYSSTTIIIAMCLSLLAGFIDAVGFLHMQGTFVSFMSGNSTRLAVNVASHDWMAAGRIAAIILAFVAGASMGTAVAHSVGRRDQSFRVLCGVSLMLLLAACVYEGGFPFAAILLLAHAMGMENATFQRDGDIGIGLTYMTGTLVKFGQRLATAFFGGSGKDCLPYLFLWLGLISGAVIGAVAFGVMELHSIWIAVIWSAGVAGLLKYFDVKGHLH